MDEELDSIMAPAEGGYQMIFTNMDATYLNCGYASWVDLGAGPCGPEIPYIGQEQKNRN